MYDGQKLKDKETCSSLGWKDEVLADTTVGSWRQLDGVSSCLESDQFHWRKEM